MEITHLHSCIKVIDVIQQYVKGLYTTITEPCIFSPYLKAIKL